MKRNRRCKTALYTVEGGKSGPWLLANGDRVTTQEGKTFWLRNRGVEQDGKLTKIKPGDSRVIYGFMVNRTA